MSSTKSPHIDAPAETRIKARAVSRGIAMGKAFRLASGRTEFRKTKVEPAKIRAEVLRLRRAVSSSKVQLERLLSSEDASAAHSRHGILEAHLLMLSDPVFEQKVREKITDSRFNAEWAVRSVCDSYAGTLRRSGVESLRERAMDFEDIAERVLHALGSSERVKVPKNAVVVASMVGPSLMADFGKSGLGGIVTERGGWTSHAFILAREIGIPAVTGVKSALRGIRQGDFLIVDGFLGEVIVNPTSETRRRYRSLRSKTESDAVRRSAPKGRLRTLDGVEITIRANIDSPESYLTAKNRGARGVGLFRSESLFSDETGFPTERFQTDLYRRIASVSGRHGARIRTFDLEGERILNSKERPERNPALGLRATRLMLEHANEFRAQIRALLKASKGNRLDIVVPMVADVSEFTRVKTLIDDERRKLSRLGLRIPMPAVGAMVEVPSAVLMAPELAEAADFLSLGTNDLVQYMVAVDRDNESVADLYRSLHPAVLRALAAVITAGSDAGKPVIVCGEMAAAPVYVAILIGLGARELSMNAGAMNRVRYVVSGIAEEECSEIAANLLRCKTTEEVEALVRISFRSTWASLFPDGSLPNNDGVAV